jgi:pimeloyl-ACP methyl ester carboxylesterase
VLLLHGQPGSARDWDRLRAKLDQRLEPLAINRPGWDGRTSATDLEGNSEAALAALRAGGFEQAIVVGHSFGAAVACRLAIAHPERVKALVLAAPAANTASLLPLDYVLAAPVVGGLLSAGALAGAGAALAARPLRRGLARRLALDRGYLRSAGRELLHPRAWRSFAAEQRTLVRELPELEPRLREIGVPATIAIGTADWVVPVSSARALSRQIAQAQLVELDGASHLLPQHRSRELAELIRQAASSGS